MYHKDKFIAPIILTEMRGMQTKRNGKVEHSDNSHDDQVFSYLMALYVWYDGKDLVEKFGIQRSSIKTDEDVEIIEGDIESAEAKKVKMDLHELERDIDDTNDEIASAYKFLEETSNFKTDAQFQEETKLNEMRMRDELLAYNEQARNAYCKKNGMDPNMFSVNSLGIDNSMISLPDNLFGGVDTDDESFDQFDEYNNQLKLNNTGTGHLVGNLSSFWNQL